MKNILLLSLQRMAGGWREKNLVNYIIKINRIHPNLDNFLIIKIINYIEKINIKV